MTLLTQRNFATGHFDVVIDGQQLTSYVKSVEGGLIKATSTEEAMGPYHLRNRHLATREIEPITIEIGAHGARWALEVLRDVVANRRHVRHNGSIVHADLNMREQYSYEFRRALITEITFPPKLDAKSKDFATIKIKLQPEWIDFKLGTGPQLNQQSIAKQKLWSCSAFRLTLGRLDTTMVTSIEPFTFKIGAKAFQRGGFKLPEYHPTKLELPKLSFMIPLKYAGDVIQWYRGAVATEGGDAVHDDRYELDGSLEILDPTRRETIFEMSLERVGPESFTLPRSEANKEETKLCKFEAYISDVRPLIETKGLI